MKVPSEIFLEPAKTPIQGQVLNLAKERGQKEINNVPQPFNSVFPILMGTLRPFWTT